MTPMEISLRRGRIYEMTKQNHGGQKPIENVEEKQSEKFSESCGSTSEKLAKEFGVTSRTIENDAKLYRGYVKAGCF
jgi:hypothetical protein